MQYLHPQALELKSLEQRTLVFRGPIVVALRDVRLRKAGDFSLTAALVPTLTS